MSERLKEEVWELDRCTGCGLCVAVCNKGVLTFDENTERHPTTKKFQKLVGYRMVEINPCRLCKESCLDACSRMVDWEAETLGKVFSLKSNVTGNVIKDLLFCGLELGAIDGVVATNLDKWSSKPVTQFTNNPEDMKDSPLPVPFFASGLKATTKVKRMRRVAIVGPPCWAQGLKRLETSTMDILEPFQRAKYLKISYLCNGAFYQDVLSKMEKEMNIPLWSIISVEVAGKGEELVIHTRNGNKTIPLTELAKYMAKGCARCIDFAGEQADITIGNIGSEPGSSTVIVRTPLGEELVMAAMKMNKVELKEPLPGAREELRNFIDAKKKRGSAVEVDKAFLAVISGLKRSSVDEDALQKLESLSRLQRKEV